MVERHVTCVEGEKNISMYEGGSGEVENRKMTWGGGGNIICLIFSHHMWEEEML